MPVAVEAPEGTGHSGGGCSSRRHRSRVSPGQEDTFHTPPQNLQCGNNSQDKRNVGSPGYEGMVWVPFLPTHFCRGCGLCQEVIDPYLVEVCPTEGQLEAQIHSGSSHTCLNANSLRLDFVCFP